MSKLADFSHLRSILYLVVFAVGTGASSLSKACPPELADLTFSGTVFESHPFQVAGNGIYLFHGSSTEMALAYDQSRSQWCYTSKQVLTWRPKSGCFRESTASGKPVVALLRGPDQVPIAKVRAQKNMFIVDFVDGKSRSTGRRITFQDNLSVDNSSESLIIRAWNCPNHNFLSCAGSRIDSFRDSRDAKLTAGALKEVELSTQLGHYRLNCNGLHLTEQQRQ